MHIPTFHQLPELFENEHCLSDHTFESNEGDSDYEGMSSMPQCFNKGELKDLTRNINLSRAVSELLVSRLKKKILLEKKIYIIFDRTRENDLLPFFCQEDNVVFYYEILKKTGPPEYFPDD